MNHRRFSERQLFELRELRDSGIPLPVHELDPSDPLRKGIFLHQTGRSSAIEINPYDTAYVISLRIVPHLSEAFAVSSFHLELPWEGAPVILLDDPSNRIPPSNYYKFLGDRPMSFPRTQVLNRLENAKQIVSRGHVVQGVLLWYAEELVPERYFHGEIIAAFVVVVDQFQRQYRGAISLYVDRSRRQLSSPPIRKSRRDITGRRNRPLADIDAPVDQMLQDNEPDNLAPNFMEEGGSADSAQRKDRQLNCSVAGKVSVD